MAKLSAILFDVDDTLFSTTQFAALARQRAVEAMVRQGLRMPVSEVRRELNEVIAEFTSNYSQHFDKLLLRLPPNSYAGVNRALIVGFLSDEPSARAAGGRSLCNSPDRATLTGGTSPQAATATPPAVRPPRGGAVELLLPGGSTALPRSPRPGSAGVLQP